MTRKQIVALVAIVVTALCAYFRVPAPVAEALDAAVAVFADDAASVAPASGVGGAASAEAGAPGQ